MYIICMFVCTYMYTDKCTGNDYISIPYRYTYTYIEREREKEIHIEREIEMCVCLTLLAFIIAEDMSIDPVFLINKYSFLNYLK